MKTDKGKKSLIKFRPELFWDVDTKTIDPQKHAKYIIERVLEFGYDNEVSWVWRFYSKDLISETVNRSRGISPFTKSLWMELIK